MCYGEDFLIEYDGEKSYHNLTKSTQHEMNEPNSE